MAFTAADEDARLLRMLGIKVPEADRVIFGDRGYDGWADWAGYEVVDTLYRWLGGFWWASTRKMSTWVGLHTPP